MAAVTLAEGVAFDGKGPCRYLYSTLPAYAVPLFVRIIGAVEATSTFKNRVRLRDEGYGEVGGDPLYVFAGRSGGYVESYDDYAADVAAARAPAADQSAGAAR